MKDRVVTSVRTFVRERQSTLASGLAALLIIVLGFMVFNYFSGLNKTKVPSITNEATQTAQLSTNQGFPVNNSVQPVGQQPASLGATNPTLPATYTVVRGDNLSAIAQKFYGDDSKWTIIAEANHLANPRIIHAGNVFTIPAISGPSQTTQAATNTGSSLGTSTSSTTISSGSTYTVKSGDTLWDIAIQAYGSGYQWYRIDQANGPIQRNTNGKPLIMPGQTLRIP